MTSTTERHVKRAQSVRELGRLHKLIRGRAEQLIGYVETLETKLLLAAVFALDNDFADCTHAVADLEYLAKNANQHTRDIARASLERHRRGGT